MFANFTEETCTGTGATMALAGATAGNIQFSKTFADGDLVSYSIEDSGGTIKVAGIGTYVSATDDITRNDHWSWNGTTVDDDPTQTNATLSGGTHTIRCSAWSNNFLQQREDYYNTRAVNQYIVDAWGTGTTTTRSGVANRLWITPFCVVAPVEISALGIDITTLASSGGDMEIGIYTIDYSDNGLTQIDKTGTIDTSSATGSTGYNTSTLSGGNLNLVPYKPYFMVVGSDGNATMRGQSYANGGHPFMPARFDFKAVGMFEDSGWSSGIPATITGPDANSSQDSGTYPNPFAVKA